jgi:HPt (histidine-containing phosphotransfer) domain-containing protein
MNSKVPVTNPVVALERLGGDQALFAALTSYFLEDAPGLMARLGTAQQTGTIQEVVQLAHGLKGLASTFEAIPFVQLAADVEAQAKAGDRAAVQALFPRLKAEFDRLFAALQSPTQEQRVVAN